MTFVTDVNPNLQEKECSWKITFREDYVFGSYYLMDYLEKLQAFETKGSAILKGLQEWVLNLDNFEAEKNFQEQSQKLDDHLLQIRREIVSLQEKQEKHLFPFLEKHIPKLGSAIRYLLAEHEDFCEKVNEFDQLSHGILQSKDAKRFMRSKDDLKNICQFLNHHFRNHMRAEKKMLHQVAEDTLNEEEKSKLEKILPDL